MHSLTLLGLSILPLASAICPGYNYAFFNTGDGWFYTANTACKAEVASNCGNICTCSFFGCSPSGSVNAVQVNGLWYNCRDDASKGSCGPENGFAPPPQLANRAPESCCRNDGNRNLEEGLIGKRHASAISDTNSLLDRHAEEYEQATDQDRIALRSRQEAEVEEAMKREVEAAAFDSV
ncbi:hypothetical protein ASPVEDRAFT_85426 [Aspergillus versicolor CBS 583.65]|uniref:Uncharacterized protein n=1 Tax=Aspergillus versicolor CBS 583.65 TaxID=1036611 RepID=A0A1L9PR61_ASPVE|nr:uncharacterized protein ASPVEDRAFT_85426 [Aspergillus versicolor CBS 583.65]OJJ04010.1 hypothetical protein ASPVEDRAFT_85426 [Aspergillus versicolor CBS 583.65]